MVAEMRAAWRPILTGELAAEAESVVLDIARALSAERTTSRVSLAGGAPGLSIFFGYLGRIWPGRGYEERARELLDVAIDGLEQEELDASLFTGFTGVAWATELLAGSEDQDDEDPNEAIDEALFSLLEDSPWSGSCDLISGLGGFAVYAIERRHRASARQCLERILDRLEETAAHQPAGLAWMTRPELLIESTRREF